MINRMVLILILLIFRSLMAMSLDVPGRPSYGVYVSELIRFARASSHVKDFNNRNKLLNAKLLKQGYRYHKLCKAFSKFCRRLFELIEKHYVSLKKLLQQGISNPEFYGDLVNNLRNTLEIQTSLIFSNVLLTVSREQGILKTLCDRLHV